MKRCAAAALGLALALSASSAASATRRFGTAQVDLTMPPDATCPADVEVLDGLGAALGPLPPGVLSTAFRVVVETSQQGSSVATVEGRGEPRRVAGATCREVAEAITLVLVLSIEADASTNPERPVVAVPPPSPPRPPPPPGPPPVRSSSLSFATSASANIVSGLLPSAAGLGTAALVIRSTRIPLEARAGIGGFLPARVHVARGELDFQAFRALVSVCGFSSDRLSFGVCTGLTVDTVLSRASNFVETPDTAVAIASVTLGPTFRYRLGRRWSIGADAEGGVVLTPTRWHVVPAGEVHRTTAAQGRLGFFGEVRFW